MTSAFSLILVALMTVLSTFHVSAFVQTSFTSSHRSELCKLSAMKQPVGPLARLKKASDPDDYNRVVEQKMKKTGMSREEAEADYNAFLENPPFYYALEKKVSRYNLLSPSSIAIHGLNQQSNHVGRIL